MTFLYLQNQYLSLFVIMISHFKVTQIIGLILSSEIFDQNERHLMQRKMLDFKY